MVVFDGVAGDEGPSSAQSRLAVHCYCSLLLLADLQELLHDFLGRARPVREVEIVVAYGPLLELAAVVGLVVEAHHCGNSHFFENWHIVLRRKVYVLHSWMDTPDSSLDLS